MAQQFNQLDFFGRALFGLTTALSLSTQLGLLLKFMLLPPRHEDVAQPHQIRAEHLQALAADFTGGVNTTHVFCATPLHLAQPAYCLIKLKRAS